MAADTKAVETVVALGDVSIHVLAMADDAEPPKEGAPVSIESKILGAGESVPAERVAPYLLESIRDGKQPRLQIVSASEASEIATKVAENQPLGDPGITTVNDATPEGSPESQHLAAQFVGENGAALVDVKEDGTPIFHSA